MLKGQKGNWERKNKHSRVLGWIRPSGHSINVTKEKKNKLENEKLTQAENTANPKKHKQHTWKKPEVAKPSMPGYSCSPPASPQAQIRLKRDPNLQQTDRISDLNPQGRGKAGRRIKRQNSCTQGSMLLVSHLWMTSTTQRRLPAQPAHTPGTNNDGRPSTTITWLLHATTPVGSDLKQEEIRNQHVQVPI